MRGHSTRLLESRVDLVVGLRGYSERLLEMRVDERKVDDGVGLRGYRERVPSVISGSFGMMNLMLRDTALGFRI